MYNVIIYIHYRLSMSNSPIKIGVSLSALFNNEEARLKVAKDIETGKKIEDVIKDYREYNDYSPTDLFFELKYLMGLNSTYRENYNLKYNSELTRLSATETKSSAVDLARRSAIKYANKKKDFPDKIELHLITKSAPKSIYSKLLQEEDFAISKHAYFGGNIRLLNNYVTNHLDMYISKNLDSVNDLNNRGYVGAIQYTGNNEGEVLNAIDEIMERKDRGQSINKVIKSKIKTHFDDRRNKTIVTKPKTLNMNFDVSSIINDNGSHGPAFNLLSYLSSVNKYEKLFNICVINDTDLSQSKIEKFCLSNSINTNIIDSDNKEYDQVATNSDLYITTDDGKSYTLLNNNIPSLSLPKNLNTNKIDYAAEHDPESNSSDKSNTFDMLFDGDACIFDDLSEAAYKNGGLTGFNDFEENNKHIPLSSGPMHQIFKDMVLLSTYINKDDGIPFTLGVSILTARSGNTAAHRIAEFENGLSSLGMADGITIVFAGGADKGPLVESLISSGGIHLDDGRGHCYSVNFHTNGIGAVAGLVCYGPNHATKP